ncbi:MAG: hypothetical protein QOD72_2673 [Acidimicrobiaceae bacterium]|nr:hypothetical protein [Acidimicrobiaceae bacterium]
MPGEVIELEGDARALVAAVIRLSGYDFALIGGLAVMVRLREAHRVTGDLDGVFDNPTDVPTTAVLIAAGIARDSPAPQRIIVLDTDVDVIDTFALPDAATDLPNDPKDRLFVCAHRYAFETATTVRLSAGTDSADVRVAVPPALIATKAHALRFATARRRATKRSSDLYDLYRLASSHLSEIADSLATARWGLRGQVADALSADLADVEQALAVLRAAPGLNPVDGDDFLDVITELLDQLDRPPS